jgi:hypothetical protein
MLCISRRREEVPRGYQTLAAGPVNQGSGSAVPDPFAPVLSNQTWRLRRSPPFPAASPDRADDLRSRRRRRTHRHSPVVAPRHSAASSTSPPFLTLIPTDLFYVVAVSAGPLSEPVLPTRPSLEVQTFVPEPPSFSFSLSLLSCTSSGWLVQPRIAALFGDLCPRSPNSYCNVLLKSFVLIIGMIFEVLLYTVSPSVALPKEDETLNYVNC